MGRFFERVGRGVKTRVQKAGDFIDQAQAQKAEGGEGPEAGGQLRQTSLDRPVDLLRTEPDEVRREIGDQPFEPEGPLDLVVSLAHEAGALPGALGLSIPAHNML